MPESSPDWVRLISELANTGWTHAKLAEECAVSKQSISALAVGNTKSPTYDLGKHLVRLSEQNTVRIERECTDRAITLTQTSERDLIVEVGEGVLHLQQTEAVRLSELLMGIRLLS